MYMHVMCSYVYAKLQLQLQACKSHKPSTVTACAIGNTNAAIQLKITSCNVHPKNITSKNGQGEGIAPVGALNVTMTSSSLRAITDDALQINNSHKRIVHKYDRFCESYYLVHSVSSCNEGLHINNTARASAKFPGDDNGLCSSRPGKDGVLQLK